MEKDDQGSTLIRIGVSGWKFLLVPAYPGCPGSKAVKRSLLLLLLVSDVSQACVGGGPIVQLLCTGHDTCWLWNLHRPWPVVWSCPGSTTAMLYSTALLISCTECRTMQLGSFLRLQDDPTAAHCTGRYTGCPFSRGSTTKWLCWRSKSAAHQRRRTSFT